MSSRSTQKVNTYLFPIILIENHLKKKIYTMKQSAESKSKAGQRTNCNCQEHDKEKNTSYVSSFNT